jgi:hypothetical protein
MSSSNDGRYAADHSSSGDHILIVKDSSDQHNQSKMDKPTQGPYKITSLSKWNSGNLL